MYFSVRTSLQLGSCLLLLLLLALCIDAMSASGQFDAPPCRAASGGPATVWQDGGAGQDAAARAPSLGRSHWSGCISRDADREDRCKLGLPGWNLPVGRVLDYWVALPGLRSMACDSTRLGAHVTRPPPSLLLHSLG